MSIANQGFTSSKAAFDRIAQMLNTAAFCVEQGAVLYCKAIPGSTMTLDQWLQLNKNGELVYASRLIQQVEDHPNYPVHAEYEVVLPDDQAEALALSWLAESNLEQTVRQLRASVAAYNRDLYAA